MNRQRKNRKLRELKTHRQVQYFKALDGVIEGRLPPEYAAERWQKLKPLTK